jgi:hypothetical protein
MPLARMCYFINFLGAAADTPLSSLSRSGFFFLGALTLPIVDAMLVSRNVWLTKIGLPGCPASLINQNGEFSAHFHSPLNCLENASVP